MAVGNGIVQTGPTELSLYITEAYHTERIRFVRGTVRLDGFGSVNADFGILAGRPIHLRVALRDADLYAFRFGEE